MSFVYNAEAQLNDGSAYLLDLETRWANKELLSKTVRFTLLPKEGALTIRGQAFPIVVVNIPENAKPVAKSRVFATTFVSPDGTQPTFRCQAIGYKLGRRTYWTWVMPTGDIEVGDEPWLADLLLDSLKVRPSE